MSRTVIVLLGIVVAAASLGAADYEQVTLKDGRTLIGFYDPIAGTVTTASPKAVIPVDADNVSSHIPVPPPKVKEPTGQEPTLDAIWDRKIALMQQERDLRRKQAAEQRQIADQTDDRSTKDEALMNARQNELAAEKIDQEIELAKKKQDLARQEAKAESEGQRLGTTATAPDAGPSDLAEWRAARDKVSAARAACDAQSKLVEEAAAALEKQRSKLSDLQASLDQSQTDWSIAGARAHDVITRHLDLTPLPNPIPANPTAAQLATAQRIATFNDQLAIINAQPEGQRFPSESFLRQYATIHHCDWMLDVLNTPAPPQKAKPHRR